LLRAVRRFALNLAEGGKAYKYALYMARSARRREINTAPIYWSAIKHYREKSGNTITRGALEGAYIAIYDATTLSEKCKTVPGTAHNYPNATGAREEAGV
jgi:hypothetical protein